MTGNFLSGEIYIWEAINFIIRYDLDLAQINKVTSLKLKLFSTNTKTAIVVFNCNRSRLVDQWKKLVNVLGMIINYNV